MSLPYLKLTNGFSSPGHKIQAPNPGHSYQVPMTRLWPPLISPVSLSSHNAVTNPILASGIFHFPDLLQVFVPLALSHPSGLSLSCLLPRVAFTGLPI